MFTSNINSGDRSQNSSGSDRRDTEGSIHDSEDLQRDVLNVCGSDCLGLMFEVIRFIDRKHFFYIHDLKSHRHYFSSLT